MATIPQGSKDFQQRNPHLFKGGAFYKAVETPTGKGEEIVTNFVLQKSTDVPVVSDSEIASELGSMRFVIKSEPVPAPRMTRRDKWLNPRRPCIQRYFDYRDAVQKAVGDMPKVPYSIMFTFYFPMPGSWNKKKRSEMNGSKHRQRPDVDNCVKAVLDALFVHDGGVSDIAASKRWCMAGEERVELEVFV